MWTDRPLIIDTDPGTDDAVALLVAAAEGLDVWGNDPQGILSRAQEEARTLARTLAETL